MRHLAAVAVGLALTLAVPAYAADTVTVGVIYRLSGAGAEHGAGAKAAIDTAVDIVNSPHQGLEGLPLGAGRGMPKLGGAKLAASFADDLGNVSVAQGQALRLIDQERVAALLGGGELRTTLAASAVAERHGVPFLVADLAQPEVTERGFKWVFRTGPRRADIDKPYVEFLSAVKQGGQKLDTVALLHENRGGDATVAGLRDALTAAGFAVTEAAYPAQATDMSVQIAQLNDKKPDAVIIEGGREAAAVALKTMKTFNYKPPLLLADSSELAEPGFVAAVGNLAQGAIDRSAWSAGKPDSPAAIVNRLYKAKAGRDLDDGSVRVLQGFLVLAEAIDRAGSADPAAVQKALRDTDLKPGQLIVRDNGIRFDDSGQNTLAGSYLVQLQGKQFVAVWPEESADGKLALPFKGWQ
jgi:branched-chain amino acid transport system substrate-binding protein